MGRYGLLIIVVSVGVDLLLLWSVAELVGVPLRWKRAAISAVLGIIYTQLCIWNRGGTSGSNFWRFLLWLTEGWICFGGIPGGLFRSMLFALLACAVCAGASGMGGISGTGVISGAFILCGLYLADRCCNLLKGPYIPVMLVWENQKEKILALRDTGNTLRDPVTGEAVLVADPGVAQRMFGLTMEDLLVPDKAMLTGKIKGLRLIPYRSVGQNNGLLLAVRVPQAKVGTRQGSIVVAFAPTVLDPENRYHALAGGVI